MLGTIIGVDGTTLICQTSAGIKHFKTTEGCVTEAVMEHGVKSTRYNEDRLHCVCYVNGEFAGDFNSLQIGDAVEIEGQPAVRIKATRKHEAPNKYTPPETLFQYAEESEEE